MVNQEIRDLIAETNELAIVFDNPAFDNSIIGTDEEGRVIYSFDKMCEELANDDNIPIGDAVEFIEYNTIRSIPYAGEYAPVICYELPV